jgi:glycosyltransferase involved in cell wall biosynthesis
LNRALRFTFVLPRTGEWPSGGLRIVYEHANRLSRRGHVVSVVHPGRLTKEPTKLDAVKNTIRYGLRKLDGRYKPDKWLTMDPSVRLLCVPSLAERFVPDGDAVIATAWETAEWVSQYSPAKGRGFYLIQHLETWNGPEERVYATWKLPLQKIVISKWLAETARSLGEDAVFIPYGMDTEAFRIVTPSESRTANQLMMLYHNNEWKGCAEGLEALSLVRAKDPDTRAILFGVPSRPETLPDWIEYHQSPSPELLRELYNRAAIFVAPSRTEGWGLTGCEALLCGAALVATDIDGHREFAFHGQTALTSPARSPDSLANNILRLIHNPELRIRLAKGGFDFVRQLTWERASASLEAALCANAPLFDGRTANLAG